MNSCGKNYDLVCSTKNANQHMEEGCNKWNESSNINGKNNVSLNDITSDDTNFRCKSPWY